MGYLIASQVTRFFNKNSFPVSGVLLTICDSSDDDNVGNSHRGKNCIISKTFLSEKTGMSRTTIIRHINILIEEGIIRETPKDQWTTKYRKLLRGQPNKNNSPVLYEINLPLIERNVVILQTLLRLGINAKDERWHKVLDEVNAALPSDWDNISHVDLPINIPDFKDKNDARDHFNKLASDLIKLKEDNGIEVPDDSILRIPLEHSNYDNDILTHQESFISKEPDYHYCW